MQLANRETKDPEEGGRRDNYGSRCQTHTGRNYNN
jgi:hypothetical protein